MDHGGEAVVYRGGPAGVQNLCKEGGWWGRGTYIRFVEVKFYLIRIMWGKSLSERLFWTGLWACLLGIVLIKLIDLGGPSPLWAEHSTAGGCELYEKRTGT